jgi:hypothetical protein
MDTQLGGLACSGQSRRGLEAGLATRWTLQWGNLGERVSRPHPAGIKPGPSIHHHQAGKPQTPQPQTAGAGMFTPTYQNNASNNPLSMGSVNIPHVNIPPIVGLPYDAMLRVEALKAAHDPNMAADGVTHRAEAYLRFLRGDRQP